MIELINLSKSFKLKHQLIQALDDINLHINQGEVVGILGKSGAGKSTLLRCVNLLEIPTSGKVMVNGVDLTALSLNQIRNERHRIGFIFQHFNLLHSKTVFENIALPLKILNYSKLEIEKRVKQLLELVALDNRSSHYPKQLSGGQQQRVAIARAIAANPHVLLCDEATSALDTESTHSILNLLKRINEEFNLTILLITHEIEVIKKICNRVGIIHEGKLIEEGNIFDVLIHPKKDITKQLVRIPLHHHIKNKKNVWTIQLTFTGKDSEEPIISTLIKQFNLTINILQAQIEKIQNTTVGYTICDVLGDSNEVKRSFEYLKQTSVQIEVLSHA